MRIRECPLSDLGGNERARGRVQHGGNGVTTRHKTYIIKEGNTRRLGKLQVRILLFILYRVWSPGKLTKLCPIYIVVPLVHPCAVVCSQLESGP